MNRLKRSCALLLAIMLVLGAALQPGIAGVFAEGEDTEQTGQIEESTAEPAEEPETEPAEEPEMEPTAEPAEKPEAEPAEEPEMEPIAEEPETEPTAEPTEEPGEPEVMAEADQYIYFDLAAGEVSIGKSTYRGYVFVNGVAKERSGTHSAANKYYIYQSTNENKADTGYVKQDDLDKQIGCRVPVYGRVQNGGMLWTKYVTNNTDVYAVSKNWDIAAADVGRTSTEHRITFATASDYTADVTIDNIWSSYQQSAKSSASRTTGGISADLRTNRNTTIQLRLKGDNRVGNVHYSSEQDKNGTKYNNKISFSDGEQANGTPGSITVADFPSDFKGNHWCSAIGGDDNSFDRSNGIEINSGVIYAGTTPEDNCTAIGGGGNQYGKVTINGGTVTAVVSSTGTAIGGGIGFGNAGGNTDIKITNGTIYAYNLGIVYGKSDSFSKFVPAAAIGGGGSRDKDGNTHTAVTITGGTVYAQSMGGAAIGGGCSASKLGGGAEIDISGGTIIAKSTGGTYITEGDVTAGVSIGGGTGKTGGGSVTLNISGENTILRTGSIGGGETTGTGKIGSANVTISGGDITGQVIMAGGAEKNCTFDMSDGTLHDTNVINGNIITDKRLTDPQPDVKIQYLEKNGGAVWMEDPAGITNIIGGTIENCTAGLGGAIYMNGGTFTLSGTGKIEGNTAKGNVTAGTGMGGGIYVTDGDANIEGGSISGNTAQVRGGGVYVNGGEVKVSGGSISSNTASDGSADNPAVGRGGGVYLTDGVFTMTGGTIAGNTAKYRGGGIFLTQSPTLTAGTISGNTAGNSGGGLCINGDALELRSADMKIFGNTATENGGGVAVLNGSFVMNGGAVGVENENPNYAKNGGGVYVQAENASSAASATVNRGNIWHNEAENGGGIYLARGEGTFTLNGENASVSHNKAKNGGGIYLYRNPYLLEGKIEQNTATENGGGMYISDCLVTLKPEKDVFITGNEAAKNGAGIYIHGSSENLDGSGSSDSGIDAISSATPTQKVGLLVENGYAGFAYFTNNTAEKSGGAVCVDTGRFYLESDRINVTGNQAENGGGVAVLKGNFTMSSGAIGEENGANKATNGGGVYVSGGEVWLKDGSVRYNEAANGGGAYVANGDITIVDGEISHNSAANNGGGFLVSATEGNVNVMMLSGKLNYNTAVNNGGGMAVESNNEKKITVEIGCLLDHKVKDGKPTLPIEYDGDYASYAEDEGVPRKHIHCPEVQYNQAGNIGGGFYLNSDASTLSFFCVEETENIAQSADSGGMDVLGGNVSIGDYHYHNHEYNSSNTDDDPRENNAPWGYISMDDATLVNGGIVDIYGDMTNPIFKDEVTVDIEDVKHDHFLDHRRAHTNEMRYKVHYIENFHGTGLYQAFQYDESNAEITIKGTLYSHPGYEILGWYTKADYNPAVEDPDNQFYPVGESFDLRDPNRVPQMGEHSIDCELCGKDTKDSNLLELYAIWEANGYTVVFDPNVSPGDTYTGTMENQIHQYDVEQVLTKNTYKYPGHIFKGWNTKADGSGEHLYKDGEKVKNLTDKNGVEIVLYAQWEDCNHTYPERWSYDVIDDGKTLRRICSCGGQTLTATLYAEDTVYDGHSHCATMTLNDPDAWGEDAPEMVYTGQWLDDGLDHEGSTLELPGGIPLHAGVYTASITKQGVNEEKAVTASIEYIIEKANQSAPEKPSYTVEDNSVKIKKVADDPRTLVAEGISQKARVQYRLSYYRDSTLTYTEWKTNVNGTSTITIPMEIAWTSYNVEVRYEELNDYKASDITRADAEYHYGGDVTVKIICDEGINYYFDASVDENKKFDGAKLTLDTKKGYYIVSGKYSVQQELSAADTVEKKSVDPDKDGIYNFTGILDGSTLTIIIGKARKEPGVKAQVTPKQKFTSFTGTDETTISRDSAFTAAFQIENFDPYYVKEGEAYGAYDDLKLTFAQAIPKGATVILLDRRDGSYWYYRADNAIASVPLSGFTEMGGSAGYKIPLPETVNGYIDLKYQFIVDFSQCNGGYSQESESLTMKLEASEKDVNAKAPDVNPAVKVFMKESGFELKKTAEANDLTCSLNLTFNEGAAASKWENRASALVLIPKAGTSLPPDAQIKAETDGGTIYLYKNSGSFIVPLSLLKAEQQVKLTLESTLFPVKETQSYDFTAEWLISPSKAGKAPEVGYPAGEQEVTFVSAEKVTPSLKTTGERRLLTSEDTLKLKIESRKLDGYTVSAALLRKSEDGTYKGIGWTQPKVTGDNLSVPLGGQVPGSFCLMLTVKQENSITIVMEVPYYFVIKPTQ